MIVCRWPKINGISFGFMYTNAVFNCRHSSDLMDVEDVKIDSKLLEMCKE